MTPNTMLDLALAVMILGLASYRLTRLVVVDEVIGQWPDDEYPRGTFVRKAIDIALYDDAGDPRSVLTDYVGKLVACTFCVGWWVSLLLTVLWFELSPVELGVQGWLVVFAVAGLQGYISSRHQA